MKTIKICVFKDNAPQAPVHVLIIPKKHIASLDDTSEEDAELLSYIMLKVKDIAAQLELGDGYRLVNNCGEDGQQTVKHLHFHLLGRQKNDVASGLKAAKAENQKIYLIYSQKKYIIVRAVDYFGFYAI